MGLGVRLLVIGIRVRILFVRRAGLFSFFFLGVFFPGWSFEGI